MIEINYTFGARVHFRGNLLRPADIRFVEYSTLRRALPRNAVAIRVGARNAGGNERDEKGVSLREKMPIIFPKQPALKRVAFFT